MTRVPQQKGESGSESGRAVDIRQPISERKLQANRANAKRSTGPRTEAGKAVSSRNALKHGILSCSLDLGPANSVANFSSSMLEESLVPHVPATDAALQEIIRIWDRLARVLLFEQDCAQCLDGLAQNARLICRYERMLTGKLHAYIREHAGLKDEGLNNLMKNLARL